MNRLEKLLCAGLRRNLEKGGRPSIPAGGELLWRWFTDLSAARGWGAAGPNPISFSEIAAYARLTSWPIEPRHVAILQAMDREMLAHFRRKTESAKPGVKTLPPISTTRLSPGMMDAMFG